MSTIRIQSRQQTWTAERPRVFTVGRDQTADVVVTDPSVSRRHAEIRSTGPGGGWELVDLGSTLGTWVEGRRVPRVALTGTTVVGFGGDQGGAFTLTITVTGATPPAPPTPPVPQFQPSYAPAAPAAPAVPSPPTQPGHHPAPLLETTMIAGIGPARPGGPGFPGQPPATGPGLLVRRRVGGDLRFHHGTLVRVGRDPSLEVTCDDTAVSRLHAVLEPRPDGWWWVDRSTSGSYVDGERVTARRIEEPTEISLGHPTAGYEVEVVPVVAPGEAAAGIARRRRRRTLTLAGTALAVALLASGAVVGGFALLGDDDPETVGPTGPSTSGAGDPEAARAAALERAKAASVLLQAYDGDDQLLWSGSGSIISEDGLILTNAHVGDPDAPGQGGEQPEPAYLTVSLTSGDDAAPATAAYRAQPIVSDGYLDVAVLQIEADVSGAPVTADELDLPEPLPIGDSDDLSTGDRIIALGYPAIGNVIAEGDRPLTVTEGVVSTFQADPIVGTERGSIDSDVRLGSGNSGGAAINLAGEIVGLNTRVVTAASMDAGSITQGSALIVPVNLATDVLDIARDGGDPGYVSPYLDDLPTDPGLPVDGGAASAGWVRDGEEGDCAGQSTVESPQQLDGVAPGETLYAEYVVEGVPDGVPFSVDFYDADGVRLDNLSGTWEFGETATCIWAPLTLEQQAPAVVGVLSLGTEVAAENPVALN